MLDLLQYIFRPRLPHKPFFTRNNVATPAHLFNPIIKSNVSGGTEKWYQKINGLHFKSQHGTKNRRFGLMSAQRAGWPKSPKSILLSSFFLPLRVQRRKDNIHVSRLLRNRLKEDWERKKSESCRIDKIGFAVLNMRQDETPF